MSSPANAPSLLHRWETRNLNPIGWHSYVRGIAMTAVLLLSVLPIASATESEKDRAARLYRERDFSGAATALEQHLKQAPSDPSARLLLSLCYQQSGDLPAAERTLVEAVARSPKDPQPLFYLARVQFLAGKLDQADRTTLLALKQGGERAPIHHLQGLILEERHQPQRALEAFRLSAKSEPGGFALGHVGAGAVLLKLGRPAEAVEELRTAVRLNPRLADAQYTLARAYLELNKSKEAEAALQAAVNLTDHKQARILLNRLRGGSLGGPSATAQPNPSIAPIRFRNIAGTAGLNFVLENSPTEKKHLVETMTGGVAAFDFDNDGLADMFFTNGAALPSFEKSSPTFHNRLYRNLGGMKFAEVTAKAGLEGAGYSMGAAVADFDNDGFADLFVAGYKHNILYRNRGDGTFEDITLRAGISSKYWSAAGGWFDYDNDGLLDLFVVNYLDWSPSMDRFCGDPLGKLRVYCHPSHYNGLPNTLYRNRGDGTFEDVSAKSGIATHIGKGMSVAFNDYDQDGRIDAFVTNDTVPNFLFRNLGNGRFDEVALEAGVALTDNGETVSAMGVDFRDIDNDRLPDLIFTALSGETFPVFRNEGGGFFRDFTYPSRLGLASERLAGWSIGIYDFNNDGWKDVFTANSHVTDNIESFSSHEKYRQPNAVFANAGDGTFRDVSAQAGEEFRNPRAHRGSAFADFDNDGRIDVVVSVLGEPAELWQNVSTTENHWLRIELEGTKSNRDGIGSQIRIGNQTNLMTATSGYASASRQGVHFGLGAVEAPPKISIAWPSGTVQQVAPPYINRVLRVVEAPAP